MKCTTLPQVSTPALASTQCHGGRKLAPSLSLTACPKVSSKGFPKVRGPLSTCAATYKPIRSFQLGNSGLTSLGASSGPFLKGWRDPQLLVSEKTTCSRSRLLKQRGRQLVVAGDSNGRDQHSAKHSKSEPKNKLVAEPTIGDRIMTATTKLLNVTAYPLGVAGLAVILPVVWTVRLYKKLTMEPMDMTDKVVLVAGASSGIGEHMAYEYARLGAKVGLIARRGEKLEEVAEEARLMGAPKAVVIEQDLGTEEGCKAAVEDAVKHFETLDVLVLNAGLFHSYLFAEATETKRFDAIMDVNFWGYVYMTYYALEHLQRSNGQIVVNSSVSSIVPQPRNSIYNASKAAVTNFFHTLRIELGDSVPITIFSPGVTKSELSDGKLAQGEGKVPEASKARDLRNEQLGLYPMVPTAVLAREAVKAARYKKHDITLPVWYNMLGVYRALAPEVLDYGLRFWIVRDPPMAKRVIDTLHIEVGQPTEEQYEKGGIPTGEKREKPGSRR